jgi:hypothetical protein
MGFFDFLMGKPKNMSDIGNIPVERIEQKRTSSKNSPDLEQYYKNLGEENTNTRCDAASGLLREGGTDGVRYLVKALKSENKNMYNAATWALTYQLNQYKKKMDKNELQSLLNEIISILNSNIENVKMQAGVNYFDQKTIETLNALREIGNSSAIPALSELRNKVGKKFNEEGLRKEYVETQDYGGTISSDSNIAEVKDIIDAINRRERTI